MTGSGQSRCPSSCSNKTMPDHKLALCERLVLGKSTVEEYKTEKAVLDIRAAKVC